MLCFNARVLCALGYRTTQIIVLLYTNEDRIFPQSLGEGIDPWFPIRFWGSVLGVVDFKYLKLIKTARIPYQYVNAHWVCSSFTNEIWEVLIRPPLPWPSSNHCLNPKLETLAQFVRLLPNDVVVLPCIKG